MQVKEFGPLHSTLSLLVRNTDISAFECENESLEEESSLNLFMIPSKQSDCCLPSDGMHHALFNIESSKRFIREVGFVLLMMMSLLCNGNKVQKHS